MEFDNAEDARDFIKSNSTNNVLHYDKKNGAAKIEFIPNKSIAVDDLQAAIARLGFKNEKNESENVVIGGTRYRGAGIISKLEKLGIEVDGAQSETGAEFIR